MGDQKQEYLYLWLPPSAGLVVSHLVPDPGLLCWVTARCLDTLQVMSAVWCDAVWALLALQNSVAS